MVEAQARIEPVGVVTVTSRRFFKQGKFGPVFLVEATDERQTRWRWYTGRITKGGSTTMRWGLAASATWRVKICHEGQDGHEWRHGIALGTSPGMAELIEWCGNAKVTTFHFEFYHAMGESTLMDARVSLGADVADVKITAGAAVQMLVVPLQPGLDRIAFRTDIEDAGTMYRFLDAPIYNQISSNGSRSGFTGDVVLVGSEPTMGVGLFFTRGGKQVILSLDDKRAIAQP